MDSIFMCVILVLLLLTLFVTIRFSWRLVQGVFILSREIEECWHEPLPDDNNAKATEVQTRAKLESQRSILLRGSLIYFGFIILLPFVFGTTMGFYVFQLIGLTCLLAVLSRTGVHYWRRHERWLNRW
ncbi:MAG: hypothetical protein HY711_02820 [Candidatus Melainabacteria bacterium]|nr:hypothetical protein [Candidatus Melainabacteria bacterium]